MDKKIASIETKVENSISQDKEVMGKITGSISKLIRENATLRDENRNLNDRLNKLEYHQRRNNFLFDGFAEMKNERETDCLQLIRSAIQNMANTEDFHSKEEWAESIIINRIHRYGKYVAGITRPIIVNFQNYKDREHILMNRRKLPIGIYVEEDLPMEIQQKCSTLRPILKMDLKHEHYRGKVKLKYDKLIVDDKRYGTEDVKNLPADLTPRNACDTSDDNSIAFFGRYSQFSNFHACTFKVDDINYNSSKQYIQAMKARKFDDDENIAQNHEM